MRLIDPAGRGPNRRNDSLGVIDHPVVFVPWPSFESMLANQGGFWIGATLILLIYFCLRSGWGKLGELIVILLVVIGLCFVEFLSLFTASLSYLIQGCSIQLTNRVQRGVGID